MIYDNEYDNDAMLTREYQRASRAIAQAEDNSTRQTDLSQTGSRKAIRSRMLRRYSHRLTNVMRSAKRLESANISGAMHGQWYWLRSMS